VWAARTGPSWCARRRAPTLGVVFDGMKAALARAIDVVLIDTAGRLHTRINLMDELRKVQRVIAARFPGATRDVARSRCNHWPERHCAGADVLGGLGVTGIILTKLDGRRGEGSRSRSRADRDPIRYLGWGSTEDLRPFDAHQFVLALLEPDVPPPRGRNSLDSEFRSDLVSRTRSRRGCHERESAETFLVRHQGWTTSARRSPSGWHSRARLPELAERLSGYERERAEIKARLEGILARLGPAR